MPARPAEWPPGIPAHGLAHRRCDHLSGRPAAGLRVPARRSRGPGYSPGGRCVAVTAQGPSGGPGGSQAQRSHRHLQISAAIPEPAVGTACLPLSCGICCLLITGGDPTAPARESTEAYRNRHRRRLRPGRHRDNHVQRERGSRRCPACPRRFDSFPLSVPGPFGLTDVEAGERDHGIRWARIPGPREQDPSSVGRSAVPANARPEAGGQCTGPTDHACRLTLLGHANHSSVHCGPCWQPRAATCSQRQRRSG